MKNENKNRTYIQNFICPSYQFNYHVNWKIEKRVGKKTQHIALLLLNWKKGPEFEGKVLLLVVDCHICKSGFIRKYHELQGML